MIGTVTTYNGSEMPWLQGKVRILSVLKGGARPDVDVEASGYQIWDNQTLEAAGGLTAEDRVEVQPWLASKGRFSFVTSNPLAKDLASFQETKNETR